MTCFAVCHPTTIFFNTLDHLFFSSDFNGDISKWNVSKVTIMSHMFFYSPVFDGDLSNWKVFMDVNITDMFVNSTLEKSGKLPQWYKDRTK